MVEVLANMTGVEITWVPLSRTAIPDLYVCSLCASTVEGSMRERHTDWHKWLDGVASKARQAASMDERF